MLNKMTLVVDVKIRLSWIFPVRFRWNHDIHSFGFRCLNDPVSVVSFIGNEVLPFGNFNERFCLNDVVDVTSCEVDVSRVAKSINDSVDFGGKASARASNTLILDPPFPPAEC